MYTHINVAIFFSTEAQTKWILPSMYLLITKCRKNVSLQMWLSSSSQFSAILITRLLHILTKIEVISTLSAYGRII